MQSDAVRFFKRGDSLNLQERPKSSVNKRITVQRETYSRNKRQIKLRKRKGSDICPRMGSKDSGHPWVKAFGFCQEKQNRIQ